MPVYFNPWGAFRQRLRDESEKRQPEVAAFLAALYICGRHGEFDPATTEEETLESTSTSENLEALAEKGIVSPYWMVRPQDHVPRYPGLTLDDAPRLAQTFRNSIREAAKGIPELYDKWQQDMRRALETAPWDDI